MLKNYEPLLPKDKHVLVEPFAGGAALFSHYCARGEDDVVAVLGDTNIELMALYRALRDECDGFIEALRHYDEPWRHADPVLRKTLYYEWRTAYWEMPDGVESTAALYALMRTSFNGIWQTCKASNGRFGTPVGLTNRIGGFLNEDSLRSWSRALKNTEFHVGSFEALKVPENSFVFCDPPYRDSFTNYSTGFNDDNQRSLVEWCRNLHQTTGAVVWLANRDAGDGFFEDIAPDASFRKFPVVYTAGRRKKTDTGFEAKAAHELLMVWE